MKTATVTEAKNGLSALIDQVKAGETVTILDRGTPVARLEPVVAHPAQEGRLQRLSRAGVIRLPAQRGRPALADLPQAPKSRSSVVAALLDERRTGR
jgi:prevent-host-death family protein